VGEGWRGGGAKGEKRKGTEYIVGGIRGGGKNFNRPKSLSSEFSFFLFYFVCFRKSF
jgi:hypothetical protein